MSEEAEGSDSAETPRATSPFVPMSKLAQTWHGYFEQELHLENRIATYHVYVTSPRNVDKDPLFVCHHGAGSSGLSFALFAKYVRDQLPNAGILSVDCRGHGSVAEPPEQMELSLATLSQDLINMIDGTKDKLGWTKIPQMVFVGHSLGGAVVTSVAKSGSYGASLVGFVVIDVVEGSAIDALKSMQTILASRPQSFHSIEAAIDWHVKTRTIKNHDSANVSVPVLFVSDENEQLMWRTDLQATKDYWEDWFRGMSKNFLAGKAAKLLILAGTDRLDKDLMIGQMQGKFQLQVFPEAGHFVQEDCPERTAEVVVEFYKRNDRSALVLPPKVSDLLKQGKKV